MKNQNKFVILITAYNDEKWVEYNIASLLNQTYSNYKVLYYDDASTDNTYKLASEITQDNNKFVITTRKKNMQALFSYEECIKQIKEDEILICLSGDDWLFDDNVLENLNNYYNDNDVWMTYGKYIDWDGKSTHAPSPQNSHYPDFVHDYSLYRKDHWRASHLRTFRGSLLNKIDLSEFKSNINNSYYDHAADLALTYPCLEMCGKDKIGVLDFYSYVYNMTPDVAQRTQNREGNTNNHKFESEIRNRKVYKKLKNINHTPQKLPQINVIGYFQETNYIPKEFTFVYNQEQGEFDATLITDMALLPYLKGDIIPPSGIIIADLHESSTYSPIQSEVHSLIKEKYQMFDLILTYDKDLLELPNSKLRFCMWRCLNKNVHTNEWPILADHSLYKLYDKTKNLSCISSNKSFLEGHKKRLEFVDHAIATTPKGELNMFGVGFNEIKGKIVGLEDYRFSVAIENENKDNWATEKISDCFLTGVIPIYYGCPNIGDYFDIDGIITFQTKDELEKIIQDIILNGEQIYKDKYESVKNNFDLVNKYSLNIDQIFNQHIKSLI
jgi:glycosyltransferase involved in cell wall biosynthesis